MRTIWGLVLIGLALLSHARAYDWANDVSVWQAATIAQPHSPRAWLNRCAAEGVSEWCYRGWRESLRYPAADRRAAEAVALVNLTQIAWMRGEFVDAKVYAQQLLSRFPRWPQSLITCDTVFCSSL